LFPLGLEIIDYPVIKGVVKHASHFFAFPKLIDVFYDAFLDGGSRRRRTAIIAPQHSY
jgi:hypothetical protein